MSRRRRERVVGNVQKLDRIKTRQKGASEDRQTRREFDRALNRAIKKMKKRGEIDQAS